MTSKDSSTRKQVALVYQAGIANVFDVTDGQRHRLMQHAFSPCEWFAAGLAACGAQVNSFHCNQAGDITDAQWSSDLEDAPFYESMHPITTS